MNVWKIAPGGRAYFWEKCLHRNLISINWMNNVDLSTFSDKRLLTAALEKAGEGSSNAATSIWNFVYKVQPGDIVVANEGRDAIKGVGVITSGYIEPESERNPNRDQDIHRHIRLVNWKIVQDVHFSKYIFNTPTVGRLDASQCKQIQLNCTKTDPKWKKVLEQIFKVRTRTLPETGDVNDEPYIPNREDHREFVERMIAIRRGQQSFREALCRRYKWQCVITGCDLLDVLEAAHIRPYRGPKDNKPANGLLLRSDIHTLFDLNLLGINPNSLKVELSSDVAKCEQYARFNGRKIKLAGSQLPSEDALIIRYSEFLNKQRE